jgi:predicted DNA binding CopG/RHH family protein
MNKKIGRPKLPKGAAKDFQIGVRFNREEAEIIKKAASKTGLNNADWARTVLLSVSKMAKNAI